MALNGNASRRHVAPPDRCRRHTPDHEGQGVFELKPDDGCFVPEGTPYRCSNWSDRPTRLIIGVAPDYLGKDQ